MGTVAGMAMLREWGSVAKRQRRPSVRLGEVGDWSGSLIMELSCRNKREVEEVHDKHIHPSISETMMSGEQEIDLNDYSGELITPQHLGYEEAVVLEPAVGIMDSCALTEEENRANVIIADNNVTSHEEEDQAKEYPSCDNATDAVHNQSPDDEVDQLLQDVHSPASNNHLGGILKEKSREYHVISRNRVRKGKRKYGTNMPLSTRPSRQKTGKKTKSEDLMLEDRYRSPLHSMYGLEFGCQKDAPEKSISGSQQHSEKLEAIEDSERAVKSSSSNLKYEQENCQGLFLEHKEGEMGTRQGHTHVNQEGVLPETQVPCQGRVYRWLESLHLLRYYDFFELHEVDDDVLPLLTMDDLREMGVVAIGARRKMFASIQQLQRNMKRFKT